jgi:hypothetical protein
MHQGEDFCQSQHPATLLSRERCHYRLNLGIVLNGRGSHRNREGWGGVLGIKRTATRATGGVICVNIPSHLPAIGGSKSLKPLMLPPGWTKGGRPMSGKKSGINGS